MENKIWIETDALSYIISGILCQLTSNFIQWHLETYFSEREIQTGTWYEVHNSELSANVEVSKNKRYYLKDCKHKVLILFVYNNICEFLNRMSISYEEVCRAQKLSLYHFCVNYCQGKANEADNILSRYLQRSLGKKKVLRAENTQILQRIQSLPANAGISGISSILFL